MQTLLDRCSALIRSIAKDKDRLRVDLDEYLPGIGTIKVAFVVDCLGAMCPRPQLLIRKYVEQARDGDVIEVISDNPALVESFPWLAEALSCCHMATLHGNDSWRLFLRKGD
jgi:tRNA 2-thiouridine synthesizing protein A